MNSYEETTKMANDTTPEIDPIKYGVLWQKVQDMDKKMDKMENRIDELLELANRGKGGLWFGMSVASGLSALIGYMFNNWKQ
jgi:hypothetical protein